MTPQADFVNEQHLKTIQFRLGFTYLFIALQWLFSIGFSMPYHNIAGLTLLQIAGIGLLCFKLPISRSRQELLFWIVSPVYFAVAIQLTIAGQIEEFKGLTIISASLFLIITMARRKYRFISPILFLTSFFLVAELLNQSFLGWPRLVYMLVIDVAIACAISNKVAKMDEENFVAHFKSEKFMKNLVGSSIKKFIAEGSAEALDGKTANGFLMQFDIRGFSNLVRNAEEDVFINFIRDYYNVVSLAVGRHGGVIHRTAGDSHIVCFGIYNNEDKDPKELFSSAVNCFDEITRETKILPERHGLNDELKIGGALDYGEIKVHIFGNVDHHREVDLLGPVLVRCARLEAYTKTILASLIDPSSILVLSPNALAYSNEVEDFDVFQVANNPIRDFGHIRWIAYRLFTKPDAYPRCVEYADSAS